MRKSISKRSRFKIFERDEFTCMYCGRNPGKYDIALEVDHKISVKDGGGDEMENLVTSCYDCNRGKRGDSIVKGTELKKTKQKLEKVKERLEQIQYISKLKTDIMLKEREIESDRFRFVDILLCEYSEELMRRVKIRLTNQYRKHGYDILLLEKSLRIAEERFRPEEDFGIDNFIKYFHGVLRNLTS